MKEFTDKEKLKKFLQSTDDVWVIKQSNRSDQTIVTNRTVVIDDPENFIPQLDRPNAWFLQDGTGGCVLEQFVEGQEVCFGAWRIDHTDLYETFCGPIYSCIEHKGAQNKDRGFVLTGEVGTTITMHPYKKKNPKDNLSLLFSHLGILFKDSHFCGLVDVNTILDKKGNLHFIEFTMRFGRPTLEVLLHHSNPSFSWGKGLLALVNKSGYVSYSDIENVWDKAYPQKTFSIGVTTYSYGYPFLDFWANHPKIDAELRKELYDGIPYANQKIYAGGYPALETKGPVQQLFALYDQETKEWTLPPNERHFIFCGSDKLISVAKESAYTALKGFNVTGITYRDDIGDNLENMYMAFAKHNIAELF